MTFDLLRMLGDGDPAGGFFRCKPLFGVEGLERGRREDKEEEEGGGGIGEGTPGAFVVIGKPVSLSQRSPPQKKG